MKRKYHGPLALLLDEAGRVFNAAVTYAVQLVGRLDPTKVSQWQTDLGKLRTASTGSLNARGELGSLTVAQNTAIKDVGRHLGDARKFAKRAFPGQLVKLHEQFQVGADDHGVHTQHDLAAYKQRGHIVLDNCRESNNAAALLVKGWLATDSDALATALDNLGTTDDTQETGKGVSKGDTATVTAAANSIWDGVLDVQTVAGRVFPDNSAANIPIRAAFRLGIYPPAIHGSTGDGPAPTPSGPTYTMTGNGDPRANGVWTYAGLHNGVPYFRTPGGLYVFASSGTGGQYIMAETLNDMAPALYTPLGGDPGFVGPWGVNSGIAPGGTVS